MAFSTIWGKGTIRGAHGLNIEVSIRTIRLKGGCVAHSAVEMLSDFDQCVEINIEGEYYR